MSGKLKVSAPTPAHREMRDAVIEVMRKFGDRVTPMEQLAVVSYMAGQLIALQDQKTVTPEMAMEVVNANLQAGNQDVVAFMDAPAGGTA